MLGPWLIILYGCSSFLLTLFWYHAFYDICAKHINRKNYQKRTIPTAMGISMSLAFVVILVAQPKHLLTKDDLLIGLAILIATCVGLLDDITNDKRVKGLKGHLSTLLREKHFTSGGLKALILAGTACLIAAQLSSSIIETCSAAILIALMTNTMNLFDLRPGRAIKAAGSVLIYLLILGWNTEAAVLNWKWYVMLVFALIAYVPKDLHGYAMLGDTGANALGIMLGILCVQHLSVVGQILLIIVLMVLHIVAEVYSISAIIERIAFLRWLDKLGTGNHPVPVQDQTKENEDAHELVHT